MRAPLARTFGSTPVRLAVGLVVIFALVNLVTLGAAYVGLRRGVEESMRANLAQHMAGFRVAASPRALEILVAAEAGAADPAQRVFVFIAPDGLVTGNARATMSHDGVEISRMDDGRPLAAEGYLPLVEEMAGGLLILGESRTPLSDLRRTFARILAFSLLPTLLVSLGLGMAIAARSRARVSRIEATLAQLTEGRLEARVASEPGRRDDLARIGAGVNRMAEAQQASTEALRQVTADIAHDLKTPLQRIAVLLGDLRAELPDDAPAAGLADRAMSEADGAAALFRSLLQIAQIEGGTVRAAFEPVDLNALVHQMAELYAPAAEDAGRVLSVTLAEGPAIVQGHRVLLGQALTNLVDNALRHTPPGTPIALRCIAGPGGPCLEVADRGPGIPEAERAKAVQRLYRLERSRSTPGNGLGLALVAATAALHGGRLTLGDSAPGLVARLCLAAPAP